MVQKQILSFNLLVDNKSENFNCILSSSSSKILIIAHSSFGHDTEDIDAEDISNTFERSHLKNDRFQNAVADFQLDDTVGDEGLDDDFDNEEREAEMDEQR